MRKRPGRIWGDDPTLFVLVHLSKKKKFICFEVFEGSMMIECLKKRSAKMKFSVSHCWIDL